MKYIFLSIAFFVSASSAQSFTVTFDDLKKGEKPSGWDHGFYGLRGSPVWAVDQDSSAPSAPNILKQTGKATYAWLTKKEPVFLNGSVEADMNVKSGKEDPEVGLVWRLKDGKNYYYARINAVEGNVVFYRMNQGKKELVKEADTEVGVDQWHRLRVQFKDEQVDVTFDGKPLISVQDSVLRSPGRAGLFTTADTVGGFDNVSITPSN